MSASPSFALGRTPSSSYGSTPTILATSSASRAARPVRFASRWMRLPRGAAVTRGWKSRTENRARTPLSMTTDLVRIGQLGRAHGVHGEIALDGACLTPDELERVSGFTWRKRGAAPRTLRLEAARPIQGRILVRFAGVTDRDQAAALTLGELLAERAVLPAPGPDEAYNFQLVGLRVVDVAGKELGVLKEIMRTGAHPVWVVRGERELLVPAAAPIVQRVDLEAGVITVDLPAGVGELW